MPIRAPPQPVTAGVCLRYIPAVCEPAGLLDMVAIEGSFRFEREGKEGIRGSWEPGPDFFLCRILVFPERPNRRETDFTGDPLHRRTDRDNITASGCRRPSPRMEHQLSAAEAYRATRPNIPPRSRRGDLGGIFG